MCGETDIIFVYLKLTNGQLVLIFRRRKTQQVFWPRHMFFEPRAFKMASYCVVLCGNRQMIAFQPL